METQISSQTESLWLLFLTPKLLDLSYRNIALLALLILSAGLSVALLNWAHPGGHAWGKYWRKRGTKSEGNKIPGPRGIPVLGSMNLMTNLAHHKLAAKANELGAKRLMAFSLGETRVIVTSNPDVAKEILNSLVFANRPINESAYSLMFNRAIGFSRYGVYWKTLRRIAATHLFCSKQLTFSEAQRFEIAVQMTSLIKNHPGEFQVRDILKKAALNNMMYSIFGRKYELGKLNAETEELGWLVEEGYDMLGQLNWSDHIPWLSRFDLQKIRIRCSKLVPKVDVFFNRIIAEHKAQALLPSHKSMQDYVDILLSLQGPDQISDSDMVAVLWEMIFRGTDTVAVLIEWILARMVLHPDVQAKVQEEVDTMVGRSRPLTESDIPSLVFLQAVVKEVLRLHPPGPLLSWARLAITDTTVDGYHVPAGTTAMVNMWAITRDPSVWSEPLKFMPERFVAPGRDWLDFPIMGSDLRLAPFGSGRRVCPGKTLGHATVCFWVASLLHEFEWMKPEPDDGTVDLSELLRLSSEMKKPLTVKVRPRRIIY
uniref:Cytochrome P450 n=1 Tax=Nothapodytes nimmoniana TaxID=159386 RepID=A0A7L7RB62_NOTNI|nr:cytochrome P450 [Nothapodytes nimmoniana]